MNRTRNNQFDWLRLGALGLMIFCHAWFVWPSVISAQVAFGVSRVCFPIFGVIAAQNFLGSADSLQYLRNLLPVALAAEPAFWLLTGHFGNVVLLFWLGFSFVQTGTVFYALGACLCDFGAAGLAAIVIWCCASRSWRVAGGLVANLMPWGWLSGLGAWLPFAKLGCDLPAVPFKMHNVFRLGYVGHLYFFAALKLWTIQT